tara:strand:- start:1270 stop:2412 length:1143 start_codon:yes stop_codon:yes gene_type:complete
MKILLIGEYSRLHNSLKKGLKELGNEVTLIGTGDLFKNYPVDISIKPTVFSYKPIPLFIRKVFLRLIKKDLAEWEIGYRFKKLLPKLKGYDVVQLINSHSIGIHPNNEINLLQTLFNQNKNIFLMACGDDYPVIKYYLDGHQDYHILTPYMENDTLSNAAFSLKYVNDSYKNLFDYVYNNVKAVIPSDIDYQLPWSSWKKATPMIPNPLMIPESYNPIKIKERKIIIFLGINTLNYEKKGYRLFEEALTMINEKYSDKVTINITRNLPFNEYISHINSCDILLDTIYAYDQGYNALEAMARGKVVFTGAEKEFIEHYKIDNSVNINALPDSLSIFNELENLILNPIKIEETGKNARLFVEKEHNYKIIAEKYLKTWNKYL